MAARRKKIQVSDPLAPVRTSPVAVNGSSVNHIGIEILSDDGDWECVSIRSSEYQLIPNSRALETGDQILRESRMQWVEVKRIWTGRFLSVLYNSDQLVDVPQIGDTVSLGMRLENSYDGSSKLRIVLMAFVLSCENGLMSSNWFAGYNIKHISGELFDTDAAVSTLTQGLKQLEGICPRITALSQQRLTFDDLAQAVKSLPLPARDWPEILCKLSEGSSTWDLMQAITHRLTRHGRGKAQLTNNEAVGDYFLTDLQSA